MNPQTNKFEGLSIMGEGDVSKELLNALGDTEKAVVAHPETWDTLTMGQQVTVAYGGDETLFTVLSVGAERVHIKIAQDPPKGKKWNLTNIPNHGAKCVIGRVVYEVKGRTKKTLKLKPIGYLEGASEVSRKTLNDEIEKLKAEANA